MIARLLLWSLADSQTSLEELRARLPPLTGRDVWVSDEATDRFGLIAFSEDVPDVRAVRDLIGKDPEIAEEFDVES